MPDRPPTPQSPGDGPSIASDEPSEKRIVVTTAQLVSSLERSIGCRLEEVQLEGILFELDRQEYVEWVAITRSGEHVWDVTDSPERLGDAVGDVLADRLRQWMAGHR